VASNPIDYGRLAARYDLSRRAEPAIADALGDALAKMRARSVLEIGAGTGNYTDALEVRGFNVIALDRCVEMAQLGRPKTHARWIVGDAAKLPLRNACVDSAACVNVLHHLEDLSAALAELRRVVRLGAALQAVVRENLETLWYRHYFPEIDSILLPIHPPLGKAITAMLRTDFVRVSATPILYSGTGDLTFESARGSPRLLFDQCFRESTSGFRRLGRDAIERGLAALSNDLDSGAFERVRARYEREHASAGDCVLLCAWVG
jgi:ubiquinone/menaquinone biosynthesis C-methylase UbiE